MEIDEFLVAFGIDTSQASKIKDFIVQVSDAATKVNAQANSINAKLSDIGNSSISTLEKTTEKAKTTGKSISKVALIAAGVSSAISIVSAKALGFINGAIVGARSLAKEKGLLFNVSESELKQADEYQNAMRKTGLSIDSIRTKIALNLLPQLLNAVRGFNDWLNSNKKLISDGLTKIITFAGKVVQVFSNTAWALNKLISGTIGWKAAMLGLVGVLAIVKRATIRAFAANPVTWILLAIAGVMLLIDDLVVYLRGGKSQFGSFWGACADGIKKVKDWWDELSDGMKSGIKLIGSMLAITFGTNLIADQGKKAGKFIRVLKAFISPLTKLGNFVKNAISIFLRFGRVLMLNPIGIIIGLIVGLGYVLYDLYKWLTTGESAFGNFWQIVADTWENIKGFFRDGVKSILMWLGMSEDGAENTVKAIGKFFSDIFDFITLPFKEAWAAIKDIFKIWTDDNLTFTEKLGKTFDRVKEAIKKPFIAAFDFVSKYFDKFKQGLIDGVNWLTSSLGLGDVITVEGVAKTDLALPDGAGTSQNNKQTTISNGDINNNVSINTGAKDINEVMAVATKSLADHSQNLAYRNLDSALEN